MTDGVMELWCSEDQTRPRTASGVAMQVPDGWAFLPPGDPALTRRVKAAGAAWVLKKKRGRKVFGQGLWAPAPTIERLRAQLEQERADPRYEKRLDAGRRRREVAQAQYVETFAAAVATFLAFAPQHAALASELARAIAAHATPVGSGTVARTERIPVERRAEAATIAWLRHHTTGYDDMKIPRVKGMRREVRRMLAERSRALLSRYRRGDAVPHCPLRVALARSEGCDAAG